jgi:hypothetical protein
MADKMVAWSTFRTEVNEFGQPTKTIDPGEEVSQSDLGISDEEWQGLIDSGAVRAEEYPEDLPDDMSPAEHFRQQEAEVAAGTADDATVNVVEMRMETLKDETIEKVNAGENVEPGAEAPKAAPKPAAAAAKKE